MSRADNKSTRLIQIQEMLMAHPEGLTEADIARRLQVNRSTVNRYLPDLPSHAIYIDDNHRWRIDPGSDLVTVHLTLHEALAVHLAARLLATRMDRHNPHAASALRKLGTAMEKWAPLISRHIQQSADVLDEPAQRHDPTFIQSLERLTQAWAAQHKARVWHHSERTGRVSETLFSPYFIEPYAIGMTTMLIGLCEPPGELRTYKIERIQRVELTQEAYTIPPDFDPREQLANAWGIWYTQDEPVEVTLRFQPRVAHRVRETRWHRSEQVEEQPDGSLIWRARVAAPIEMLNWIRGWGADVEVLGPEEIRETVSKQIEAAYHVYYHD